MSAGVVPETSIDTLLMYAYAQRGVEHVELKIDRDDNEDPKVDGKAPKITYKVRMSPAARLKLVAVRQAEKIPSPFLRKAALAALSAAGAPIGTKDAITAYAKDYLPPQWQVFVEIEE